jgi:hypothetical protein
MAVSVELLRVNPALLPLRVPPEFEKSMLFANAAVGKPMAKSVKSITRLMLTPYLPQDGGAKAVRLHIEQKNYTPKLRRVRDGCCNHAIARFERRRGF